MPIPSFQLFAKYEKKLIQPYSYKKIVKELDKYFQENTKYNIYSLSNHFLMSKKRFINHYVNNKDEKISEIIKVALSTITANAFDNAENGYQRTLKYIISQEELSQPFIERDEAAIQTAAKVLVLPPKDT